MNQRRITFLLFYAISALSIAVTMGRAHWLPYYRLVRAGTSTQAVVTQTSCADRSTFSYRFTARGQTIDGHGGAGHGNPRRSAMKPSK
jgi:hypothetical protein